MNLSKESTLFASESQERSRSDTFLSSELGHNAAPERRPLMILGMSTATYTLLHVLISLTGIASGSS